MLSDLHIHTCFSDGTQTPEEVAAAAQERNLAVISVCDHDNMAAYPRLRVACAAHGLELVAGVELSVQWRQMRLHLLGYGMDGGHPAMQALFAHMAREMAFFDETLVCALSRDYPQVRYADFLHYETPAGQGGWRNTNYLRGVGLFARDADRFPFYERYGTYRMRYPELQDACAAVLAAGGVPVLAHPSNWWPQVNGAQEDALEQIVACGAAGLECYYPAHTQEQRAFYLDFCARHGLRITAGGDGHGAWNRVIDGVTYDIGAAAVDVACLQLRGIR